MVYGYIRVSSRDQCDERQRAALLAWGVPPEALYADRCSGKDFQRPQYLRLMRRLRRDDLLVVKSIDRLGRDYAELPQPGGQRRGLLGRARHLHPPAFGHGRGMHDTFRRQRHRRRRRTPPAPLRAVLPYRQGALAQAGRHGTRAGHRQTYRRSARRTDHGPQRTRRGQHVFLHAEEGEFAGDEIECTKSGVRSVSISV